MCLQFFNSENNEVGVNITGMIDFELPVLAAHTSLRDAFGPMIKHNVSGLVVDTGNQEYRLLHFAVIQHALEANLQDLRDIPGGIKLEFGALGADNSADYEIKNIAPLDLAVVRSRHEPLSFMYRVASSGYACSGPAHHTYPPQKRGLTNHCVVPGCPGTI